MSEQEPAAVADLGPRLEAAAREAEFDRHNLNDDWNALRFAAEQDGRVLYATGIGWHLWDGRRWGEDTDEEVTERARETVRAMKRTAAELPGDAYKNLTAHAHRSGSDRALGAMLKLARSDRRLRKRAQLFDADPMLMTVNNGTLDLETGELREHDPADLITRLAPVDYDPDAKCPLWQKFLARVLDDDAELIEFV